MYYKVNAIFRWNQKPVRVSWQPRQKGKHQSLPNLQQPWDKQQMGHQLFLVLKPEITFPWQVFKASPVAMEIRVFSMVLPTNNGSFVEEDSPCFLELYWLSSGDGMPEHSPREHLCKRPGHVGPETWCFLSHIPEGEERFLLPEIVILRRVRWTGSGWSRLGEPH